jgi:heme oxygenase
VTVTPLSVRLREGTKASHRLAETSPFIREFFAGRLTPEAYRLFLVQLLHVYTALEAHQERHRAHAVLGQVYFPALHRVPSLEQDLNHYYGNETWRALAPHPATALYVQRLEELSAQRPDDLVAHHYTRYLGDLSGGQALKRIVAKMFQLENGAGLAFYDFPGIADHAQFKDDYRARLDALPLDEAAGQSLIDEANHAFTLNRGVFEGMLAALPTA